MELKEIKALWNEQNKSLDNTLKVNSILLKNASVDTMKSLLRPFTRYNIFEFVSNALFAVILLGFVINHYNEIRFALPGLILLIITLYTLVQNIIVLRRVRTINYLTPITTIQKRIESLRLYNLRQINWLYWLIPLFYACFMIVALKGLIGLDVFVFPTDQLIYQFLGAVVITPIIVWFLKKFPDEGIASSLKFIESIETFEKED